MNTTRGCPSDRLRHVSPIAACVLCVCFLGILVSFAPSSAFAAEPDSPSVRTDTGHGGDYVVGAGDVLEVLVWKESGLSRTVNVRPDGKISLPLVDDIQAAQSTLPELKKRITQALAAFVEHPSVSVMLEENRSKKIYIVGEVNTPGEYVLERKTTILQAIASAAGFTQWAKKDAIVIIRNGPKGQFRIEFDYDRVISGKDIKQNIVLSPDDVIVVP